MQSHAAGHQVEGGNEVRLARIGTVIGFVFKFLNMKGEIMNFITLVRSGLLALLFALSTAEAAQPLSYINYGHSGVGETTCGGVVNGQLQKPCGFTYTKFEGDALGECPKGTFFDLFKWSCWECPTGFARAGTEYGTFPNLPTNLIESFRANLRALVPVDGPRACLKPNPSAQRHVDIATYRGRVCPKGSFFDPTRDGECWSCPSGYERTVVPVEWADACVKPANEDFSRTNRYNRATGLIGTDCPQGQFWDGKDGYCYACPSGYGRTAYPVDNARACAHMNNAQVSKATLTGKAVCKPGEFGDPRNGGECWTCRTNFDRTIFPVDGTQACEIAGGWDYARAKESAALTCPAGQTFDLVNAKHTRVQDRVRAKFGNNIPKDLGSKGGGTCWSCPAGYRRTVLAAWDQAACESNGIDWKSPDYVQPGLFGFSLEGNLQTVVMKLIQDRTLIEEIAKDMAKSLKKKSEAQIIRETWEEIATTPQKSGALALAVFSRLQAAATNHPSATAAERGALISFSSAVVAHRTFLADQALQAYRAWDVADRKKNEVYSAVMVAGVGVAAAATSFGATAGIYAMGVEAIKNELWPLPDFTDITMRSVVEDQIKGEAVGFVYTKVLLSNTVLKHLFPNDAAIAVARKALSKSTEAAQNTLLKYIAQKLSQEVAEKAAAKGATLTAKAVAEAFASAGPQILAEVAIDTIIAYVEMQIERANAVPRLDANLAEAKRPFDVGRLLGTVEGANEVSAQWATIISGAVKPSDADKQAISGAVNAILAQLPPADEIKASVWATKASGMLPPIPTLPRFVIVSGSKTCLQAAGNRLALTACNTPPSQSILWSSESKTLKTGKDNADCLTLIPGTLAPALAQVGKDGWNSLIPGTPIPIPASAFTPGPLTPVVLTCAKKPNTAQQWDYKNGQIVSGDICLEARGNAVAVGPCNPANQNQKWQAIVAQ